jgi:hypothetical protein
MTPEQIKFQMNLVTELGSSETYQAAALYTIMLDLVLAVSEEDIKNTLNQVLEDKEYYYNYITEN